MIFIAYLYLEVGSYLSTSQRNIADYDVVDQTSYIDVLFARLYSLSCFILVMTMFWLTMLQQYTSSYF